MTLRWRIASWLLVVAVSACATIGMLLGLRGLIDRGLHEAIATNAEAEARIWATFLTQYLNEPSASAPGERLQIDRHSAAAIAERVGRIFRFRLYDSRGRPVFVQDPGVATARTALGGRNPRAAEAFATGKNVVQVRDGRREPGRPDLYADVYVPMWAADGAIGVVGISSDETASADAYRSVFTSIATLLALLIAVAFAAPSLALYLRSRQARRASEHIRYMARHDALTGLLNRSSFAEQLAERAEECRSTGRKLVMAYIDVDNFKTINDEHGHQAGDAFLRHVAKCLSANVRATDLVARFGGDEFALALTFDTVRDVHRHVDRIRFAVMQPVTIGGRSLTGHISVGVYVADGEDQSVDALMHKADVALYQAKSEGRNTCRMFAPEMDERMSRRRAIEARLREALADGTLALHYQARLDRRTKTYTGFEALLRLPDGEGGWIAPKQFIPVAEATGLINRIGVWVLETATRTAAGWPKPLCLSVNLSAEQFRDGRLPQHVRSALESSGLAPHRLEVEVLERLLTDASGTVNAQLAALRSLGVGIAVDDFGTGSSSFAALWRAGFDRMKIDREFIQALARDPVKARDVLETMVLLAHRLGIQVTAEGIETAAEADALSALACDELQGFLYGQPVPADEIAALLARESPARTRMPVRTPVLAGGGA